MAQQWDAPAKIGLAARRGDAPAKIRDGGTTMGCAGLNRQWDAPAKIDDGGAAIGCASQDKGWWHDDGMRRPK